MKKVYYLSYYDIPEHSEQKRNFVLAAVTKSSYICNALASEGFEVEIVSAAGTASSHFCPGSITKIAENLSLRLFDAKPAKNLPQRILARRFMRKQLRNYLLKNVTKDDALIVYHSLAYMDLAREVKEKKNPLFVIEANEIYSDVTGNEKTRTPEMSFLQSADAYILSTELLNEKVNINNKPFVVNYGTFEETENLVGAEWGDGKIHAVYAGVLEPRKGAGLSVAVAEYLPENYHIHIIGFGREQDIEEVKTQIEDISAKTKCTVTYDGKYSGEDYLKFLQGCQIGFSTQSPNAAFNASSFPSKVLSYLSNGLRVVSVRIPAIECSKVADLLYFYDGNDPRLVADLIKSIDFNDGYDSRASIKQLDMNFKNELTAILENEGITE